MAKPVIHISEVEAASNFAALLDRVRAGRMSFVPSMFHRSAHATAEALLLISLRNHPWTTVTETFRKPDLYLEKMRDGMPAPTLAKYPR